MTNAIQSPLNLLSTIYARIYFPTYSNGLKEIAAYLGYRWPDAFSSGLLSIAWREKWALFGEPSDREKLIRYHCCPKAIYFGQQWVDIEFVARSSGNIRHQRFAQDVV